MGPGPKAPKRPGRRAGPGPGESLLVCCARAQGSVGRTDPYIGVCNTNTHIGGQLIAAATVVRSAPSYGLALRAAFGRTQS